MSWLHSTVIGLEEHNTEVAHTGAVAALQQFSSSMVEMLALSKSVSKLNAVSFYNLGQDVAFVQRFVEKHLQRKYSRSL